MGYQLGVDIGTSYTAAAVNRGGVAEVVTLTPSNPVMPSVVLLKESGEVLVGDAAVRRGIDEPSRVAREFKRRLGDPTPLVLGGTPYGAEALMGHLLAEVVGIVTEREGTGPDRVVLTHPANYGPYKLDQMREVARLAGVDLARVMFLTEPEAAAVSYATANRVEPGEVVAVYDFGGGTFDAALVRREADGFTSVGRPEGMDRFGGIDIDAAILEHLDDALDGRIGALDPNGPGVQSGLARLQDDCRLAKEALSTDVDTAIPVNLPGVLGRVTLSRAQLEAMIRPRLNETIDAMTRAISSAGLDVADVARVLLVGGSSRIPLVANLIRERTGLPVSLDAHPKFAIATGAAASGAGAAAASPVLPPHAAAGGILAPPLAAPPVVPLAPAPPNPPLSPPPGPVGGRDRVAVPGGAAARRRRTLLVGAAIAAAVTVAAIVVVIASGGKGAGTAASSATVVAASTNPASTNPASTQPSPTVPATVAVTSPRLPAGASTATTSAALPAPLTFTGRVGFTGREDGGVFGVETTKAEVVETDGRRSAVIHTKVTNFAAADISLGLVKAPVLLLADGSSIAARFDGNPTIPGGGTTPVNITAPVGASFTFAGASLVFGNNASNQTIMPFDESVKVTTFAPIVDVGKGTTVDSGTGTVATITGGVLHADYKTGSKGNFQLELLISVSYNDPAGKGASDIQSTFTLTLPDGTSASSTFTASIIFAHGNQIVASGNTEKMTPLFDLTSTYAGTYTLSIGHQRSVPPNPAGEHMTMSFTVAAQP